MTNIDLRLFAAYLENRNRFGQELVYLTLAFLCDIFAPEKNDGIPKAIEPPRYGPNLVCPA